MSFTPPDWRDESNYPDPNEITSLHFWAWEFLRRNQDYQNDWNKYAERLHAIVQRVPKLAAFVDRIITEARPIIGNDIELEEADAMISLLYEQPEFYHLYPPAQPGESSQEWEARAKSIEVAESQTLGSLLGEKWGLGYICNPATLDISEYSLERRFLNSGTELRLWEGVEGDNQDSMQPSNSPECIFTGYLTSVKLDLRLPESVLRAQFAAILAMRQERIEAKHFVPFVGRPEKSLPNFRNYLRTLDGLATGATVREIAEIMLPHYGDVEGARKTVDNWKTRAIKIRDSEYALLPAHAEIKVKRKVKER